MPDVVLVTGVSRYIGGRFARRLTADGSVRRVIGVDVVAPRHDIGRAEFVRADIRNPLIGRIIEDEQVDTVVHLNVIATPQNAGGRASQKDINVIGTMQLLAGCQRAQSLRHLVVKSSSAVYGSTSRDPAMFTEDMAAKVMPSTGFGKDSVEVEGYVRGFSRRRPDVDVSMLRMANVIGPGIRTGLTDYFRMPMLPAPLGFDARMGFLHEDDAVESLMTATLGAGCGIVNVSGAGVITLSQAAAIVGRPMLPVPLPVTGPLGSALRQSGVADFSPDQVAFLTFGRGMDTARMRTVLGFTPARDSRATFEDFAASVPSLVPGLDAAGGLVGTGLGLLGERLGRVVDGSRGGER